MDHTTPHWNHQLCGLEQQICLEQRIWKSYTVVLFIRTMVFSWPVDLIRKTAGASYAFSLLFGFMFFLLFSLENLQVAVNGAWGEDWGYWSKGKMPRLFLYSRFAWLNDRSSLERELYKYYTEISSSQSTLPSPVPSKIGPDVFMLMSNVKRTWSFFGWKTLNSYAAFVWARSLQSNKGFCWVTEPETSTNVTYRSPFCTVLTLTFSVFSALLHICIWGH